jgi:rhodanese-related sulfurtransferase
MKDITVDELATLSDPVIVDVREPDEFASGHADGAILIPLGQLAERVSEVPTGGDVFVICQSGGRSLRGQKILADAGIESTNVLGGTAAWREANLPTATGS